MDRYAETTTAVCGVVLGLGTKYGLVRYWWVTIKLVLNIVLTALVLVTLRPEVTRGGRVGPTVRGWRTGLARGGRPDLSADRFPDRPAYRGGVGSVQAVGSGS